MKLETKLTNKYPKPNHKYSELTQALDKHNQELIKKVNQNIKLETSRTNEPADSPIKVDNSLVGKYTEAIYHEYKIPNPFAHHDNLIDKPP
jgi:hypothetical protein